MEKSNRKILRFEARNGFFTSPQRSKIMSKIKGKNTKPELLLRRSLWASGIRYRVNYNKLPGNPDILIKKYSLAIFVDGVFWHGYNWEEKKKKIVSNREFWITKIERNMERDKQNQKILEDMGYTVLRFWDFEVIKNLGSCVKEILDIIYYKKNKGFDL